MSQKHTLSYVFNMSLGLIPAIIAIVLCEFIPNQAAMFIGTALGVLYCFYLYRQLSHRVPNFILYITTGILTLLSLISLLPGSDNVPDDAFPITLETGILLQMLLLYFCRNKIAGFFQKKWDINRRRINQSVESAVVSARVALLLGIVHMTVIAAVVLFGSHPLPVNLFHTIFYIVPGLIFISCIILNQVGICVFNRIVRRATILPVVNAKGDVIGRTIATEAPIYKNAYTNPVVRVAVVSHGMLFLCRRTQTRILDKGKIDVPLERYLRYGETLEDCARQLVEDTFPHAKEVLQPIFSISYRFKNNVTNRLNYLFILEVKDDTILCDPQFEHGKLWTFNQIDQNLGKEFFGTCLEEEYEHLKLVIDTRERYKVS